MSNVFPVIRHKLFEEHHEYLLIGSTVYVVFPFRFLPMLHGLCLYQVIVNHGQERFALYCVIFLFFLYFGLWYFRYRLLF
nr:MAG TPA: Membrane fusion protein p14 fusion protein transmembrane domain [Bacteriophage sp.]